MIGEEILIEIDATLDGLIRNAEVIEKVELSYLSETEVEAFQKTQESLIQHLLHLDQHLEQKRKNLRIPDKRSVTSRIQQKLSRFEKMESDYHESLAKRNRRTELLSKRRTKRFLTTSSA